ncbi:glycoside hydrolase/phage tail family protein [Rhodobacteraceae bacterium]|nr:glycoside hydrolase/phage tail family protein [Paracoccaceae bacterium]
MATILLSAAGASLGSSIGGSVLGISASVLGQAAGATLGRVIDSQILGSGSPAVETGKIDRFRLTGASEGAPIAKVHGRTRVSGQVIWSSRFQEDVSVSGGGGKGAPSQPKTTSYSYSVSLAVALCHGEITRIGRIWADGNEVSRSDLNMRVYTGTEEQLPDPKIEAVEGVGQAPAYRGTAYVVIEDLHLAPFGNRAPQFSFEVMRSSVGDPSDQVRAVAIIPGTGEYSLATTPVHFEDAPGKVRSANVHSPVGGTDFEVSLEALSEELPNCASGSLIVSWFGDDLRCGSCEIKPKVEQTSTDGQGMPWTVSGVSRTASGVVPLVDSRPVYGGTPSDRSVIEAITAMRNVGQDVMFYPFILMEQLAGNGLIDPWTGDVDQPVLPWRGRITSSLAPGVSGSPDGTAAADGEVAAFFGAAMASEFSVVGSSVSYIGSDGFSYRRFILHYAHLCALAGGVEAFCIGSEMRSLTQIRGAGGAFPAVEALRDLAGEVRTILGPDAKIGYAADWSEYFGYHPQDGSGDLLFHLDPLWSDADIDFVGIDNYMPLSDWRDGFDHTDATWGSVYNPSYLKANIAGGEGFDWYYASAGDEAAQVRTPITDGTYDEPWVWRYKDLEGWWSNPHHNRLGGVRQAIATGWAPGSKPIWFTEVGCAAVDKGTNQPNKFLDPKSSESSLPKYSNGARDDLIQMQYLRAMTEFWDDPANNPVSTNYGAPMVATDRMFLWAWDARPYPYFPGNFETWSDGENYARGHWLNGRVTTRSLAAVIKEICVESGVSEIDVSGVHGLVRGYALDGGEEARTALQPLLLAYGVDAIEADGVLVFRNRTGLTQRTLAEGDLAWGEASSLIARSRAPEAEISGRVRLTYVDADGDYEVRGTEGIFPDEATVSVTRSELPLALTKSEAQAIVERWLAEARVARDGVSFALPPSADVSAGDTIDLEGDRYRIDRVAESGLKMVEGVRVERGLYQRVTSDDSFTAQAPVIAPLPVWVEVMNLPLLRGTEAPEAPWIAATSEPWPGEVAVYTSLDGASWAFDALLSRRAVMGTTLNALVPATPGLWDRGAGLEVALVHGALASVDETSLFAGGNVAAIGAPGGDAHEVFQFRDADLIAPDTWALSMRLRGQRGTENAMAEGWSEGSTLVVLDGAAVQLSLSSELRNVPRLYRVGPASKAVDHSSYVEFEHTATGVGLRPFAPVHLRGRPDGSGGHVVNWVRRTRIDGDNWALPDVPLGEAYEAYRIRVISGGELIRDETVSSQTWTYDTMAQFEDGITAPFEIEVAQISDLYGPGDTARIVIND